MIKKNVFKAGGNRAMIKKNVFKAGKKLSKQATMLAMAGMLLANPISVFAKDINASTTSTGSTTATLTIDQEMINELGKGLVVTIPNELNLSYDAENSEFSASDTVQAKGAIEVNSLLIVNAPTTVNYVNQDKSTVTVEGAVSFGTDGKEMWSTDELYNSITTPDKRNIKASVSKNAIKYKGTYKSEIIFSINVSTVDDYWKTNADSLFSTSSLGDGTIQITGLTSDGEAFLNNAAGGRLAIPATINSTAVSAIGSGAFAGYNLTEIVVSEGITSIDASAFGDGTSNTMANTITYTGTKEQWTNIGYVKPSGVSTITVHCTDGDITL